MGPLPVVPRSGSAAKVVYGLGGSQTLPSPSACGPNDLAADATTNLPDEDSSMPGPTIIERAYHLARAGDCETIIDIGRRLKREHFESVEQHLAGGSIKRELRKLLEARKV